MNNNSKKTNPDDQTTPMTSRQVVNSILEKLQKNGHNVSDMTLIHKGLENGKDDLASKTKESYKVDHHRAAATKAYEILTQGEFKCKKNSSRTGDPESIESGHALKLMHDGLYLAIVIDTKNPFQKNLIQSGIMFLPKHLTGGNKVMSMAGETR